MIEAVRALWDSLAGRVGTEAPPVLVRVALRSSAGRRRLNKKEKKKTHCTGRCAARPSQKRRVRASRFLFSAGACSAMRTGGGRVFVFSPPAWPGRCKGERGGRLLSLLAPAPAKKKRTKWYYAIATTTRTAARPPRPAAAAIPQQPPPLVTVLHLAALRFRPVATAIAIMVMVAVVVFVAPRMTSGRVVCARTRMT